MHEIEMNEASEEFVRCWQAAGTHIENQAQGDFRGWLRGHLAPPFLEHLSFRLGNQLFFIRLLDKDNLLETPGSMRGLLYISRECKGHACVMRMEKRKGEWIPVDQGWGLLDAISEFPVNPPALISDETILMTDWEVQDFAVQVVRDSLKKDGYELLSWNGNPEVNPSIWFAGESGPEWIVVRPSRGLHGAFKVIGNIQELEDHLSAKGHKGHQALVRVISAEDPQLIDGKNSGTAMPLYRGHGMYVDYKGLENI